MNKALLLLLVTLVHSQSDGILLPSPSNSDRSYENLDNIQLEDWDNSDSYPSDSDKDYTQTSQVPEKRSATDLLTRRSSLDKNFMRFGRGSSDGIPRKFLQSESSVFPGSRPNFNRYSRGLKDNFIRFGRGAQENFIRFGRGSKDSFIRFGRVSPDFFRSGKSERVNFIRFGKADKNFMRFGREKSTGNDEKPENLDNQNYLNRLRETMSENEDGGGEFERFIKAFGPPDNFIRFGKSGNQKEGRNGTNFLRFGKSDPTETNEISDDAERATNQESYPGVMRVKRKTMNEGKVAKENGDDSHDKKAKTSTSGSATPTDKPPTGSDEHPTGRGFEKRSTGYFAEVPEGFPRRLPPVYVANSWQSLDNLGNARWTQPYFPVYSNFPNKMMNPYLPLANMQSKRDQEGVGGGGRSGSNFIRFG